MTWNSFLFFALPALALWAGGAWTAWKKRPLPTYLLTVAGLLVYFAFILGLWLSLSVHPSARWVKPACGMPSSCPPPV